MFLRSNKRIKDGKEHRYYTVVESRRLGSGRVAQRQVLYLGEINDSQQAAWRKTLEVFDEDQQRFTSLSLFAEDRPAPAGVIDSVQVKLSEMKLQRARPYGNCCWDANCGGNCNWTVSGNGSCPRDVKTFPGHRFCNCW